ncbi:RHS repeat domain-containing protein [Flagellimonas sp. C4]|uniref:RHS repeat domain-containing protein n=1 Tax=Flagellimonas alginolytica TaxID=3177515 RepID=UPI0035C8F5F3
MTYKNPQQIAYIYNASGLVAEVHRKGEPLVKFFYTLEQERPGGPFGDKRGRVSANHRVRKEIYGNGNLIYTIYYVRDVAGQTMAVYNDVGGDPALEEQPVYGAGRIGIAYNGINNEKTYVYELTDHLGNVRAVFIKNGNDANLEGYTDYYPFGMPMPNRTLLGPEGYRYAFQGQEKDPETGKEAFQLRLWDSRIGRWLTTDPYGQYFSPYLGMGNDPINRIDPDGGQDCNCKGKKDPPDWSNFFNNFFQSINSFFASIGSENGPDQDYMDQVNKQQDVLNALTADLQGRQEFMQTATTIASLPVGMGSGSALSASLVTKGGFTAIAKRTLFSFSTKNAGRNAIIDVGRQLISNGGKAGRVDGFDTLLNAYTGGIGSSILGGAVDVSLNGGIHIETSLSDILVNAATDQVINSVHTKVDGVIPDELLSPSGEIYKGIFKSSAQGFIDASVNN